MPCSICGRPGHNASSCYKQPPDAEKAPTVGLTAGGGQEAKKDEGATLGQQSSAGAQNSDGAARAVTHGLPGLLVEFGIVAAEVPLHEHKPLDIK